MDSDALPAFLWEGDPPGRDYDPNDMTDSIFKGYLPVRVGTHIFKGPSAALGGESRGTRPCNAILHDMTSVEAEHVTYSCVLTRHCISSRSKWCEVDGKFKYADFYYGIINLL